jgi:hypothetical protein
MADDEPNRLKNSARILEFPASANRESFADLGPSELAKHIGAPGRQGTGHWCSHCRGIWFGYPLEVACPRCGSRQG